MTDTPLPPVAAPGERVRLYLERTGLGSRGATVVPLTGDASDRRYYRVLVPGSAPRVLQVYAESVHFDSLPFVNVADLLMRMPVPIPAILDHQDDLGVLALEDLGDVTLQASLGATSEAGRAAFYRQAVGIIATLQRRGRELASNSFVPYRIAFDVEKLGWEMDFFIKHFVQGYRGVSLDEPRKQALRGALMPIVEELASEPRVLCHRDYHSRNLMVHNGQLYVIDFQDARMGPDTYDLVSLLRDSYVELSDAAVNELIAYFLALVGATDREKAFRARFDLMSLQRNLKALGTFGYQTLARQNPVYIQYIPRTLEYVRITLARNPRFATLRQLLGEMLGELRDR